ncbi:MAG TPA: hypothetical protein VGF76_26545, partial [Polyangiaceae bacterium]
VWASFLVPSEPALAADGLAASSEATSSSDQAAADAYQRALAVYAQGDVKGAFASMRESYRLSKRPELLYNLARLEDELHDCQASLEDYRGYLERVPQGRYRQAAEQAIQNLGRSCPAADSAPPTPPQLVEPSAVPRAHARADQHRAEPAPQLSYWTTPRWIGWSAIAAGTLAGVGALYFTLAAIDARDEYRSSFHIQDGIGYEDSSFQDRQHRDQTLAQALAVTGGALIAGGALVLILDPRKHEPARASALIYIQPSLLGACYSQNF